MKKIHKFFNNRKGVALVTTLGAVVLLTVLILAFFSRAQLNRRISFSSTNLVKADMMARSALDIVTGEIRQELANAIATPSATDGFRPQLSGVQNPDDAGIYTIRQAAGSSNLGSSVTIDKASLNGRFATASSWFTSGPGMGSADLPSWVYLTRGSGVKTPSVSDARNPSSQDFVVGRFTYTVYDTSGMLDANMAGYPISTPFTTPAANIGSKASTVYADLTELDSGMVGKVDQLVTWRNASLASLSLTPADKIRIYDEWATGIPTGTSTSDLSALNAARSGHLVLPAGDNAFISRRDLIHFVKAKSMPEAVLPALTHFTRSINAPACAPTTNIGSFRYADDAKKEQSGVVNRDFSSVVILSPNGIRVTRYRDDGSIEDVATLSKGEPLMQRKFSLAKLAWLGHDGPNIATFNSSLSASQRNTAIKTVFGLTWDNTRKRWIYNHGDPRKILTLHEVCQNQEREPDFFELLKAGILNGSLGNQPGNLFDSLHVQEGVTRLGVWGPSGMHFVEFSGNADRHILQIGTNIIDQADSNNFPTAIYGDFVRPGPSYAGLELFNTVFGVENLPVLSRTQVVSVITDPKTTTVLDPVTGESKTVRVADYEDVWIQPEVWNPHDPATAGTNGLSDSKYATPVSLRMVTYGGCLVELTTGSPLPKPQTTIDFGTNSDAPDPRGMVYFKNPPPNSTTVAPFFNKPVGLTGYGTSKSAKNNYAEPALQPFGSDKNTQNYAKPAPGSKNELLGVWLGHIFRDPETYPGHSITVDPTGTPGGEPHLTFVLQYYDGSTWRPYSMISRINIPGGQSYSSNSENGGPDWLQWDVGRPDPRTDRFSTSGGTTQRASQRSWDWNLGAAFRTGPGNAASERGSFQKRLPYGPLFHYGVPVSTTAFLVDDWAQNIEGTSAMPRFAWYEDPDSAVRPGDGLRGDLTTGDGIMLYPSTYSNSTYSRRRPIILNRPFRSVGELGYVYRDQPFKTLDFWSDKSADGALLNLFSISDQSPAPMVAGQVNLSAASPKVLRAILSGTTKQVTDQATDQTKNMITSSEADAVGAAIASELTTYGPLGGSGDLVKRLSTPIYNAFSSVANTPASKPVSNKTYAEAPIRALGNITSSREWSLLIDVMAQSGRVGGSATGLQDFTVEGERRYWLHLTIDRTNGAVMDSQLELFNE